MPAEYRLLTFDSIDSTNAEALRRMAIDGKPGDVIWARQQTAGRGRRGREWVSLKGNLFLSLIVEAHPGPSAGQLAFVTALGVATALEQCVPDQQEICLKWPNDICIKRRKLGGILIEGPTGDTDSNLMAVGIGLNIQEKPFPESICLGEIGCEATVEELVEGVCHEFDKWHLSWKAEGFSSIRQNWLARAAGLGESITVTFPDGSSLEGKFNGIDKNGALELWRPGGTCETIATGEVFFATA